MSKIFSHAHISFPPIYTSYMNGCWHAHFLTFPCLPTVEDMGLPLLSAVPYPELEVLLPILSPISWGTACSLRETGTTLCQTYMALQQQQSGFCQCQTQTECCPQCFPTPTSLSAVTNFLLLPLIHPVKLTPFLKSPDDLLFALEPI